MTQRGTTAWYDHMTSKIDDTMYDLNDTAIKNLTLFKGNYTIAKLSLKYRVSRQEWNIRKQYRKDSSCMMMFILRAIHSLSKTFSEMLSQAETESNGPAVCNFCTHMIDQLNTIETGGKK